LRVSPGRSLRAFLAGGKVGTDEQR